MRIYNEEENDVYTVETVGLPNGEMMVFIGSDRFRQTFRVGPGQHETYIYHELAIFRNGNNLTFTNLSTLPKLAARLHSQDGSKPLDPNQMVASNRPEDPNTYSYEVEFLGYNYSLIVRGGTARVWVESPDGEITELGSIDDRIGPFLRNPEGIYFFPYHLTEQGIEIYSLTHQTAVETEAVIDDISPNVSLRSVPAGALSELTYFGLNQSFPLEGSVSWLRIDFDLAGLERQVSADFRNQALFQIFNRLKAICRQQGIPHPVIVIEGDTLAIYESKNISPAVWAALQEAISNSDLIRGYQVSAQTTNGSGTPVVESVEVEGIVSYQILDSTSDPESRASLIPPTSLPAPGLILGFPVVVDEDVLFVDNLMITKMKTAWEHAQNLTKYGIYPASIRVHEEGFEIVDVNGEVIDLVSFAQYGGLTPEQIATRTPEQLRAAAVADLRAFNPELFVAPGEYRTIKIGENILRVVNLGGRYMAAVGPEGAGQALVWQPLPLSGEELALDGGRVIVRLENGNVSARTVDVQAELTASFSALLQAGIAQLSPGLNNLKIENGRVRLATEREVPDAFLTLMPSGRIGVVIANQEYEGLQEGFSGLVRNYNSALAAPNADYAGLPQAEPLALVMPEGFEDLQYRIGNEAAEILAPHLAGQESLDTRGLIRALRKFRDTGEITGALAELEMPAEQLEQLRAKLIEVHGDYVRGRVYRFGKIEEAINNGDPMDQATVEANLETLRRIAAQPNLTALIGADRLAALQTKLEARLSTTPEPLTPAAPIANPIVAVLMNDYHLTAAQVEQVMGLFIEQGLSEQEFTSKLAEIAPDLAANINQLKQKLNQAILAQLTALAAADPEATARLQEQFAMHGGRLGFGDIFSEIGEEYIQEHSQGGIMAVLGSNSPILQFLLEPVVEAEFWTSVARGQFGALKEFFSTAMPATGAGIVGASAYNVLLNIFGVSKDSWARGVLPQVTVGVLSAMNYTAGASGALGRTLSRLLSNPVTQRLFVALSLNPIITDGVARLFGVTDEFEVGGRIARQAHPLAYDIISSLPGVGKEYATGLINIFDPDATYDYEMGLAERSAQAEITGQNVIDALSALTLLYIAQNPPVLNPELYGDIPHLEITDNPEVTDPEYYRQLVGYLSQAIAAQGPQGFDPALLGGTEELLPFPPAGLNLAEAAYTMLVGIESGADISGQIPVYQALGLMDGQGRPIEGNSYVEEGRQLLASRRQNEEETGLVHEIASFIEHEGAEAIDLIQGTNREIDQAEATGLVPTLDVNLPMELLADIRGVENIDPAQLMEYVIEQNQEAIDDLKAAQQKIIDTLHLISRALAGEAVDIDFSDPTVQSVLKYLKSRLPAQP